MSLGCRTFVVGAITLIFITISGARPLDSQTLPAPPLPGLELDTDALMTPGGPYAREYRTAVRRARRFEKEGAFAEALEQWEKAHTAVQMAVYNKEFGTYSLFTGIGNGKPLEISKGTQRVLETATSAARAAARAGRPSDAMMWAGKYHKIDLVREFEAEARAAGRVDDADRYKGRLALAAAEDLERDLEAVDRRRKRAFEVAAGAFGFFIGLVFVVAYFRGRQRRPKFTYREPAQIVRQPRPVPTQTRFGLSSLFGVGLCAAATAAIVHGSGLTTGQNATLLGVLGTVLGTAGAWLIAVPAAGNRWFYADDRALDDVRVFSRDDVLEMSAWLVANDADLRRDFADVDPVTADREWTPQLRATVAMHLSRELTPPPAWDEIVGSTVRRDPLHWEPLVRPYVERLGDERRTELLAPLDRWTGLFQEPLNDDCVYAWLELAMVTGRRWPLEKWRELFVDGPYHRYVPGIIWAVFDGPDLRQSFVATTEGDFIDEHLETLVPTALNGEFGVAHAGELESADAWGEVLADFELHAPFTQLQRPDLPDVSGEVCDIGWTLSMEERERLREWLWMDNQLRRPLHPFGYSVKVMIELESMRVSFASDYASTEVNRVPVRDVSTIARREVHHMLRQARGGEPSDG